MLPRGGARFAIGAALVGLVFVLSAGIGGASGPDDPLVKAGRNLFLTGCSSCHGVDATGRTLEGGVEAPTLFGVGEAAADFQLSTGRMPLSSPNAQSTRKPPAFTEGEIEALVAYVGSLTLPGGAGPPIPEVNVTDPDLAEGGELFRANCAACHNASGSGGALSRGRHAPTLWDATPTQLVEAMRTGPGQMPVFGPDALSDEQADNIAGYALTLSDREGPGGFDLGAVGPVPEGFVAWVALTTVLFSAMAWITRKARRRSADQEGEAT